MSFDLPDVLTRRVTVAATLVACCLATVLGSESVSPTCGGSFDSLRQKTGTFSSPNYPNPYPADVSCRYTFQGHNMERVQIYFSDFDVGTPLSPEQSNHRDNVCDDTDGLRAFIFVNDISKEINVFCGNVAPPMLMSSDNRMELTFSSRASPSSRGFTANYSFVTDYGIKSGEQSPEMPCGFIFRSSKTSNGTFTSPNFPGLYPRNVECHYLFYGQENECVHITFASFDVDGDMPSCHEDLQHDYVEFSNFNVRLMDRKMSRQCGSKEHLQRREFNSDSNFFRVTFKSNDVYDATGFEAFYQFRRIEDPTTASRKPSLSSAQRSFAVSDRCTTSHRWAWLVAMATQTGAIFFANCLGGRHPTSLS